MDIAGEILSAGFWAELAYTIPEDMEAFAFNERFPLFEGPYFKYILGLDYTADIGTGIYLNAQYLHGFFDEADYSGTAESLFGFKKGMFFGEDKIGRNCRIRRPRKRFFIHAFTGV